MSQRILNYEFFGDKKPYHHQMKAIKHMLANKRGYLWLDMGTGKTASALWFSDILLTYNKVSKILIIAPLSTLKVVWAKEIESICPYRKYVIVHGNKDDRINALNTEACFYITNTDATRTYYNEFIKLDPDIIIIDEVTDFSNATSQRSKSLQKMSNKAKCVYGLSGSPVAGGLLNSYGIAKAVNPQKLPTPYFSRYRDSIMYKVNMYEYIPKENAINIVNETLSPAIKVALEDCVDIPGIIYEQREVKVNKSTYNLFTEMYKNQIAEYKQGLITAATAGVKAIRLIQILTGFTKTIEGEIIHTDISEKLSELVNIYHESGNKLIVFAQSIETIKIIKEYLISKKINTELIYGDVKPSNRALIIDDFQRSKKGVLVAQVKTMSHGINLTAAHTLVFFGPIHGNDTYRQAIRRIRRNNFKKQ